MTRLLLVDLPDEVLSSVKQISLVIRCLSLQASVFTIDNVTAVVHPLKSGHVTIHIYDFNRSCHPLIQLRDKDKRMCLYENKGIPKLSYLEVDTLVEALKLIPEIVKRQVDLKKSSE
jgi:hypothetical protein